MNKKELRTKFFEQHTVKDENRIPKIVTHPHNLFEWMYEQLTLTDVGVPKAEQLTASGKALIQKFEGCWDEKTTQEENS